MELPKSLSDVIADSKYSYTAILWHLLILGGYTVLSIYIFIVGDYVSHDNALFDSRIIIWLPYFHFYSFEIFLRGSSRPNQRKRNPVRLALRDFRDSHLSSLSLILVIQYLLYYGAFIFFLFDYREIFISMVFASNTILLAWLIYISFSLFETVDEVQSELRKYIIYKMIVIYAALSAELLYYVFLDYLRNNFFNIFIIIPIHVSSLLGLYYIEKQEKYSLEFYRAGVYENILAEKMANTPVSSFLNQFPGGLVTQKRRLEVAHASLISLSVMFFIAFQVFLNIISDGSIHIFWRASFGIFIFFGAVFLVISIDNVSELRRHSVYQLNSFQKAIDQIELANKKYMEILGEE